MKNDILNWVLFWPKKEWNPHSKALFFSWYGLWGDNIILTVNKIKANIGINIKKNVKLVMLCFLWGAKGVNIKNPWALVSHKP